MHVAGAFIVLLGLLLSGCDSEPDRATVMSEDTDTPTATSSDTLPVSLTSPVRLTGSGAQLAATDYQTQYVFLYDKYTMQSEPSFAIPGAPLAIGKAGSLLYIGNETSGSVEVYNFAGTWQFDLGGAKGLIGQPQDLAIDEGAGFVFVVDGAAKNVKIFDLAGTAMGTIADAARIYNPTAVALDTVNLLVFISDYGKINTAFGNPARVHTYTYTGTYVRSITGSSGGFSRPQGVTYDDGHLFVVDAVLGQVLIFDSTTGAKLKALGSFGSGPGELQLPLDVAVDAVSKDVYVTNNRQGRIEVFAGGGTVP